MCTTSAIAVPLAALCVLLAGCEASSHRRQQVGDTNDIIAQLVRRGLLRASGKDTPQRGSTTAPDAKGVSPVPRPRYDNAAGSILRPRVIEGTSDVDNKYPFVLSFQMQWTKKLAELEKSLAFIPEGLFRSCSGSLITETWVLTAAHCAGTGATVRYGDMSEPFNTTKNKRAVLKAIQHPSFDKFNIDIGLMLLSERIPVTPGRVSAVEPEAMLGHSVAYAGFGGTFNWEKHTEEFPKLFALDRTKPLQIGEAVVDKCGEEGRKESSHVICLKTKCSQRAHMPYKGDSGGPLLYNGRIAGVCKSGGFGPNRFFYTPVGPYLDWINAVISTDR